MIVAPVTFSQQQHFVKTSRHQNSITGTIKVDLDVVVTRSHSHHAGCPHTHEIRTLTF